MDFMERLRSLSNKVSQDGAMLETEEATKTALIMPFIHSVLGYDIFDPSEVVPEFTADTGIKKGEKVDYALLKEGKVQILIECKKFGEPLSTKHASQLLRYFSATDARIAILTNGNVYEFYTDLDALNKMDETPFLILDMSNIDEYIVPEIKKLTKAAFDVDSVVDAACELKYLSQIKRVLAEQFKAPEEDFIKFFTSRVYSGRKTAKIKVQFAEIAAKAFKQFLNDTVNARLKSAMAEVYASVSEMPENEADDAENTLKDTAKKSDITTTQEELDGFYIVKAIMRAKFDVARITYKDRQSYFVIMLDDSIRKILCRLYFNSKQKYLSIIDENRKDVRYLLNNPDDIFNYTDILLATASKYA